MSLKSNYNLLENYIYISHLGEEGEYLVIPTTPDSIQDTMQSTFAQTNALSTSAPVFTYSNSGPRDIQISLNLHRDMMDDVNYGVSNVNLEDGEDYIDAFIRKIQSIAVPKYNLSNKAVEPPMVAVRLGKQIFVKGVVTSGIAITYAKPILSNDKYAQVSLSITISEVDPYDATTVYRNGSFRGEVRTLREGAYNY